jgi:hypothetical protein
MTPTQRIFHILAWTVSIIMHPLLMLTYMLMLMLVANPYLFGFSDLQKQVSVMSMFFVSFLLPSIAILLLKLLGFVETVDLRDRQDRTIPFIVCGIFYLWVYLSVIRDTNMPLAISIFTMGVLISLAVAFVINLYFKISLHAIGSAGFVGMIAIAMWMFTGNTFDVQCCGSTWAISMNLVFIISILLAGLTGWARLYQNAHTPQELYSGYALGLLGQFIALKILF